MTSLPYLIGIALIEQNGVRTMPIGGKSLQESINKNDGPSNKGKEIALEILLRVMDKSQQTAIRQAAGGKSLLLLEMPLNEIQENLPKIKAQWISEGNNEHLLSDLSAICKSIWSITFEKHKGVLISRCF
ncbi:MULTISPECIES: hypothetical protein [Prochlorococcus]|uniref:hypothetical protein n=1 Tax=Prochlorococcus TaxID=1218 RepID=UPI000533A5E3|nr:MULTISPECIES: hypothetical protein [Prochlorococcus]KGG12170.1 hypothetical protein EV05_1375 [Prochlorococcus sp. MIT 0601]